MEKNEKNETLKYSEVGQNQNETLSQILILKFDKQSWPLIIMPYVFCSRDGMKKLNWLFLKNP